MNNELEAFKSAVAAFQAVDLAYYSKRDVDAFGTAWDAVYKTGQEVGKTEKELIALMNKITDTNQAIFEAFVI